MKSFHIVTILLFIAGYGFAFPIDIEISASPTLPLPNILQNAGFEEGMKHWQTAAKEGVGLSTETVHNGKSSLRIEKDAIVKTKSCYCLNLKELLKKPGQSYIISGWLNANPELDNSGGLAYGAGFRLSVYDRTWKKHISCRTLSYGTGQWARLVSEPIVIPEWAVNAEFHIGVFYIRGTAFFDDIFLTEAYTELSFHVKSPELLQVILEDETGRVVFDSGELPAKTDEFAKKIKVLSPYRYSVQAINRRGETIEKSYPLIKL